MPPRVAVEPTVVVCSRPELLTARAFVISKLLVALGLMAVCVMIHGIGVMSALRWLRRRQATIGQRFWPSTWLLIRLAGWMVLLHLSEITVWAWFYLRKHAMPEFQPALYFSAVTYTTTGYGDLVLPKEWQLVGAVEALTGILMCGWSTGFFFAVVSRMFTAEGKTTEAARDSATHGAVANLKG